MGTGGNSQYFGFSLYYPKGQSTIYINRTNPDLDYSWFINTHKETTYANELETFISFGLNSTFFINNRWIILSCINPIYILSKNATFATESWNMKVFLQIKIVV